jgi:hypothetical protein
VKLEYREAGHLYLLDGLAIPSLTQMLDKDGCNEHLSGAASAVVQAKAEWGSRLHLALQKVEYGLGVDEGFQQHCVDWLTVCERMKWGGNPFPIWKNCELPTLGIVEGLAFGFTPDRAAPEAIVEIKGTYSMHYGHGIQTALQVLGMGYSRETPRFIAYFDKEGFKRLVTCGPTIKRDGQVLDVWEEAERILFEHGFVLEEICR